MQDSPELTILRALLRPCILYCLGEYYIVDTEDFDHAILGRTAYLYKNVIFIYLVPQQKQFRDLEVGDRSAN